MNTYRLLYNSILTTLLLAAVSCVLVTGAIAEDKDGKKTENKDQAITHRVDTRNDNNKSQASPNNGNAGIRASDKMVQRNDANINRRETPPATREKIVRPEQDNSAVRTGDRNVQHSDINTSQRETRVITTPRDERRVDQENNGYLKPSDKMVMPGNTNVRRDNRNQGPSTDNPNGYIKPEDKMVLPGGVRDDRRDKPQPPVFDRDNNNKRPERPNINQDNRDNRPGNRPDDRRKPDNPRPPADNWRVETNKRQDNPQIGVEHRVNTDRGDNRRRPVFQDGRYHYTWRPEIRPALYPYWAFDYDTNYCKSIYFYYGPFKYIDMDRIHVRPYVQINYYSTPIMINDDYYLVNRRNTRLNDALYDIRKSWVDGRSDLIREHVADDQMIAVLLDGRYDYSIEPDDYMDMTSDAVENTNTISFEWGKIRQRVNDDYTAYGLHRYRNSDGDVEAVYVSYTLRKIGRDYYIVEVGSSRDPLY